MRRFPTTMTMPVMALTTVLVLSAAALFSSCAATKPGAVLSFQTDSIDVGTLYCNDADRTYTFDFRNEGRETLHITDVRVSCSCMKVEVEPREVPSRGKGRVTVRMNLSNYYPMEIDKTVGVYSNDASSPAVLRLTGLLRDPNY